MPIEVPIQSETIRLDQMLKLVGAAQSGGHAKHLIQSGLVSVNGAIETRRGLTLRPGDEVGAEVGGEDEKTRWTISSVGPGSAS